MASPQVLRITAAARLFALLALAGPALWQRDSTAIFALVALLCIGVNGVLSEWRPSIALFPVSPVVEAALVGGMAGFALGEAPVMVLALAIPPFVAAVQLGTRGMLQALAAQLVAVVVAALLWQRYLTDDQGFDIFTWSVAGLGLGLIGSFLHATTATAPDPIAPYLDAQRLIRQLISLSEDLSSGLDVNTLGGAIMSSVSDEIPATALGLYAPSGETLVPVVARSAEAPDALERCEALAVESWARNEQLVAQDGFAFPIGGMAVVAGVMSEQVELDDKDLSERIARMDGDLRTQAVQLDTALMFSDFRDAATADERRRLAREMHDGVAQDIASLGYLVDALAAKPADPKQAEVFRMLRERITHIVAEVRQSVLSLRTSIGESESLGAAISSVARHLSEVSGIPIHVTLDEHTSRLRPEVEAELFRIAQEAMNNAIKHARASNIRVHCRVHAPSAAITVSDDGRGLQGARSDSHGMKIMRERARLISGELTVRPSREGGVSVCVQVGADTSRAASRSTDAGDKVGS